MSNAWKDWWRVGGTEKAYIYVGTDEHAVIPRGCESVGTGAFGMSVPVVEVSVPASVKELDGSVFRRCNTLRRINVDEDNPYFKDVDGVLYSRDGKSLIYYPPAKGNRVVISEGVVEIKLFAFLPRPPCEALWQYDAHRSRRYARPLPRPRPLLRKISARRHLTDGGRGRRTSRFR